MTDDPRRILLVRLSSVGDIVLATPVARWLRQRFARSRIHWLVDAGYEPLVAANPRVDRVVAFDYTGRHRGPAGIRRLAEQLGPVDLVVDLQNKLRTALLRTWLRPTARRVLIKRRGVDLVRAILGRDPILRGPHQVQRNLAVVGERLPGQELLTPELVPDAEQLRRARQRLSALARGRPVVGLVPEAKHATKAWPFSQLAALGRRCHREGLALLLLGGRQGLAVVDSLAQSLRDGPLVVHHGASLAELIALLAACALVVSPDSGPAHIAAAVGVPVVALFGPTSPERWAPLGPRVEVVRLDLACSPCSNHGQAACPLGTHECMHQLRPETVWQAVAKHLRAS